jgi:hypothetical protein
MKIKHHPVYRLPMRIIIKTCILILFNLVNTNLNGQDVISIKIYNDSMINRYINSEFTKKCKEGLKIKRSSKREKKDQRCLLAFYELYQFIKMNEANNNTEIIHDYIASKKSKFFKSCIRDGEVDIIISGGNYYLDFGINTKERKIRGGLGDNLMNIFCNNYSFMDYPYIRDVIMKDFPFKIKVVDYDVVTFSDFY